MAKAKKLSLFECGQIVELQKQGHLQWAIPAEVGRSKTVSLNFLKDPEGYGTKKSSGRPPKIGGSDWLSLKIWDDLLPKLSPLLLPTAAQ